MKVDDVSKWRHISKYWKRVFALTCADTLAAFASNPRKAFATAIITLLGAGVWALYDGGMEGLKKAFWYLCLVGVYVILFLCVFAWQLIQTPAMLDLRMLLDAMNEQEESEKSSRVLTTEKAAALARLEVSERTFLEEKREIKQQLLQAQYSDPKKNALREEIKDRIKIFESVIEKCERKDPKAIDDYFGVDHRTYEYLKQHVPEYTKYSSVQFPVRSSYTRSPTYSDRDYRDFKGASLERIARLREVLQILS